MTAIDHLLSGERLIIIYDGDCPFCSAYVRLLRLREAAGAVDLVNARQNKQLVSELYQRGIKLDEGMVVVYNNRTYSGGDAINILSLLATGSDLFNKVTAFAFRNPSRAAILYPVLRSARNLVLKILRKPPIAVTHTEFDRTL